MCDLLALAPGIAAGGSGPDRAAGSFHMGKLWMPDFSNHDHDYDGRPPVGWHDDDPLLERLCRYHPERIPDELRARFQGDYMRARAPLVAAALSLHSAKSADHDDALLAVAV